jgi:hypothetical protein
MAIKEFKDVFSCLFFLVSFFLGFGGNFLKCCHGGHQHNNGKCAQANCPVKPFLSILFKKFAYNIRSQKTAGTINES